MSLAPGTRLGAYEVLSLLGAGGMGEVYRARDTKLNRDVALKVLPDLFAVDPDRLARFRREAQVLASLNHPNIAAIYGLEEFDGVHALVLELVEGETLADRLRRGPIPVREALPIAQQIADALEAAHEKAIVHRDLKPSNIALARNGAIKVLDFGLAKMGEVLGGDASQSPTMNVAGTRDGMILGTVAYMSPEQARGTPVDARTDVWAFACILYELLCGKQAFSGRTATDVIAAIIEREPKWDALPESTPAHVRYVLTGCLEKDADMRLRDIHDVRIQLASQTGFPSASAVHSSPSSVRWILPTAAAVILALILGVELWKTPSNTPESDLIRFSIVPPEGTAFSPGPAAPQTAISPDGRRLAMSITDASGKQFLAVRDLDSTQIRVLPETDGAGFPFWSPDSQFIGFSANGRLKKIEASGSAPQTLTEQSDLAGGTWNRNGVIVFSAEPAEEAGHGLRRISAAGGQPLSLTSLDQARQETAHRFPSFLPDGNHFLYLVQSTNPDNAGIYVGSLDSKIKRRVLDTDTRATFVPPGYLLFLRNGMLMAQQFDLKTFTLSGEPFRLADEVGSNPSLGRSTFSVSEPVLTWRTGTTGGRPITELVWYDRSGKVVGSVGSPGVYYDPALSMDNTQLAVERLDSQSLTMDIWLFDLRRGTPARFTFSAKDDIEPAWSPDASDILFSSNRERQGYDLYRKRSDGSGSEEVVLADELSKEAPDWSSDGKYIVYSATNPKTRSDIWALPTFGDKKPVRVIDSEFSERFPRLSPNGKWLAYVSNESGRDEIYVQSFPPGAGKFPLTATGGTYPQWRRDGKELFYYAPDGKLISVEISEVPRFTPSVPKPLFEVQVFFVGRNYAATSDGQRFLINRISPESLKAPITVVVNWAAALIKR